MFGNVITAMITPFKKNKINYKEAQRIAKFLEKNGSNSILLCGSTGESHTMEKEEKSELIIAIKEAVSIPIIVGIGTSNTKETIGIVCHIDKLDIDGFLLVTPYYNKPSQNGIFEHFKLVAKATKKPIIIYNIPGRCAKEIEVETIFSLSKISNIIGLKAACGNLVKISQTKRKVSDKFLIYSGDDSLILPILSIGGVGVISVASHIIGKELNKIVTYFLNNNLEKSKIKYLEYFNIFTNLFCDTNPVPIKYAMSLMGFDTEDVRLPLVKLSSENKKIIYNLLKDYNLC